MKILVLTTYYPPLGGNSHGRRCGQVVERLSAAGHSLQVLTSNYRLPPMGVNGERGVFREFYLQDQNPASSGGRLSYRGIYQREDYNTEVLLHRLGRFKPSVVLVWDLAHISKSILFRLQKIKIPVVYEIHSDWLHSSVFSQDAWYWWWRSNRSVGARIQKVGMLLTFKAWRMLKKLPALGVDQLDLRHAMIATEALRISLMEDGLVQLQSAILQTPAISVTDQNQKNIYRRKSHFMWIGHLDDVDSLNLVISAVQTLKDQGICIKLDIHGLSVSSLRKALRNKIQAAGLSDQIQMIGVRPADMESQYAQYDALLHTNHSADAFPVAPIEAMLLGLPSIIEQSNHIEQIVEDGKTALLFENGDPNSMAKTILSFLNLKDAGKSIGVSCIDSLQAREMMPTYIQCLESLLCEAAGTSS